MLNIYYFFICLKIKKKSVLGKLIELPDAHEAIKSNFI